MGLLTYTTNITLDGCNDHEQGVVDDETHAHATHLLAASGAVLWGRVTYEMMEAYWPPIARGEADAPEPMRAWARTLETHPKYVASSTRSDYPWTNSHHLTGDLREAVQRLKDATPAGVLVGGGRLATELDRLGLIDEYQLMLHPRIVGRGPTLFAGLDHPRHLELVSARPMSNSVLALHYRRVD